MRSVALRGLTLLLVLSALTPSPAGASPQFQVRLVDRGAWVNNGALIPYLNEQLGDSVSFCLWADRVEGPDNQVGGFDFSVCYDTDALTFLGAIRGANLHPDWEYFSQQLGDYGDSCAVCPNGFIRIYGIANTLGGITPAESAYDLDGCIAELSFRIGTNPALEGLCPRFGFCAYDCTDNVISSRDGDTLYFASSGLTPGPLFDSASCRAVDPDAVLPEIEFIDGWVCIIPSGFCACPFQSDHDLSGTVDAADLATVIDIVFFGGADVTDPFCPRSRSDFDANGAADAGDLALLIDHVFFGGAGPADPCAP